MPPVRHWLPRSALSDAALTEALSKFVRAWSETWFTEARRIEVRAHAGVAFPAPSEDARAWRMGEALVTLAPRAPFGLWMLGQTPGSQRQSGADAALLHRPVHREKAVGPASERADDARHVSIVARWF